MGGWFHTGDGGSIDEGGYLTISDRKKDVIITGGENVSSIEVEDCLFSHPAVAEVAVIGVPDERWGETVIAVVGPKTQEKIEILEVMPGVDQIIPILKPYKLVGREVKAETSVIRITDELAIGVVNRKTTAVRLVPVPGKRAGDRAVFGGLFGESPILPIPTGASDDFVRLGGRIPAPLVSLNN